jgi:chromosome partitioning protein
VTIVAVCNHKGGSGKTTTSVNLAAALAEAGSPSLVVDLDPQCSASRWLGADDGGPKALAALTGDGELADQILPTPVEGVGVVPATALLGGAERSLAGEIGAETLLRRRIVSLRETLRKRAKTSRGKPETVSPAEFLEFGTGDPDAVWAARYEKAEPPERERLAAERHQRATERARATAYEWVLLDCPPSMGILLVNALAAADRALVPVEAHFLAAVGLAQMLETIRLVKERLNPGLELLGILPCRLDARARHGPAVVESLRGQYGAAVLESEIRQNVRLAECAGHCVPITRFDPRSAGAQDYRALAREVTQRTR